MSKIIVIDARPYYWNKSGINAIVENFVKNIDMLPSNLFIYLLFDKKMKHDVSIPPLPDNVSTLYCSYFGRLLWTHIFVPFVIWRVRGDVFLTFLERDIPLFVTGHVKKLVLICDIIPWKLKSAYLKNPVKRFLYISSIRYAIWRANHIVTISNFSRTEICEAFNVNVSDVSIIRLGPSLSDAKEHKIDGLQNRSFVLTIGGAEPRKNVLSVIEAFKNLKQEASEYAAKVDCIVVVGGDWRSLSIRAEGEFESVLMLGHVSDPQLLWLYKNCKFFVFPSLYEGFGIPLLDAMSNSAPVLASSATSIPEVGGAAPMYDDVCTVASLSEQMRKMMGEVDLDLMSVEGLEQSTKFSWELMMSDFISIIFKNLKVDLWRK